MSTIPHSARIVGHQSCTTPQGKKRKIPRGPCMVEPTCADQADIVWGSEGEKSAAFSLGELESAAKLGHLLLLDRA